MCVITSVFNLGGGYVLLSGFAWSYGNLRLSLLGYCQNFLIVAAQFYIPTRNWRVPITPHLHHTCSFLFCFKYSHPKDCEVVSHFSFDLYFPSDERHSASRHVLWPLVCLLWGNVYSSYFPFFLGLFGFLLLSWESFIYSRSEALIRSMLLFSHQVLSDSFVCPWTVVHQTPPSMDSPGKNTGVYCHFLLQGILSTQEWNPRLLHCRQILHH